MTDYRTDTEIYIDALSDPGFKILFGRETSKIALIGFLNSLLNGDGTDPITDLRFLDKEKVKEDSKGRTIIYDILCETACKRRFIVEMQNQAQGHFIDRTIYYVARGITEQGQSGSWRYDYMPVYGIFFTNYSLKGADQKLRTDVMLCDLDTRKQFSDKVRLIYIQLPEFQITDPRDCKDDFEKWIYLLKNMNALQTFPFSSDVFRRVEELCRVENLHSEERRRYERELKAYRDMNNKYMTAIEEGEIKGIAKGRALEKAEMVRALVTNGVDLDTIAKSSGLSIAEIENILKD